MAKDKELTEQEELFIQLLFDEEINPDNDPEVALELAGYPKGTSYIRLLRDIKSTIQDDVQNYFLAKSAMAAKQLTRIAGGQLQSPFADKLISACTQVLDRAGVTKKDRQELEIKAPEGIVILPPLNSN